MIQPPALPQGPLLPPNATPLERAIEAATAHRHPLPVHLIADARNPDTCPPELLAWLAWDLSVDIWQDEWPVEKKRSVIRNALTLHRLKTTPAGIKAHVELADGEVVDMVRPPAREYMRRGMTDAMREAWLDSLPQVRIYPYFQRATARAAHAFASRPEMRRYISATNSEATTPRFAMKSRGFAIYHRRAEFHDRGNVTPVSASLSADGVVERIALPLNAGPRRFLGHNHLNGFMLAERADLSLLTVRVRDSASSIAVSPSATPVDVRPRRVAQRRTLQTGRAVLGRAWINADCPRMIRSAGPLLLYDRIALAVPGRMGQRLKATGFAGHGRFGIAPFRAELRISVPMKRPRALTNRFYGHGWSHGTDMRPF
ncbi:MAG: phage tail protein I, partial [Novosphingobium sp.]|nr:phage tail protein I [Novosphingobium sp.]